MQALFEDGFPLGAFEAEPCATVPMGRPNAQHVGVMLELSLLPG